MSRWITKPLLLLCIVLGWAVAPGGAATPVEAGGGCRGLPATAAAGDNVVMSGELCFTPTVLYTERGATVTWTNDGPARHSVAGATLEWGNYDEAGDGESIAYRFDSAGTYPYYCFTHNGMVGAVVVGDGGSADEQVPPESMLPETSTTATHANASDGPATIVVAVAAALIGGLVVSLGLGVRRIVGR